MPKLNQIIAVVNGKKSRCQRSLTDVYHKLQKPPLFEGITRTYEPSDEDGETFPDESKNVQFRARDAIREATEAMTEMFDAVATQDWANTEARADVVVEGRTVLEKVPVTHLLFLEKQLGEIQTFVSKIPTLDPAEDWHWDENADCWATARKATNKTKKVPRSHVLYDATEEHPAQVEMYHEDVKVGEWQTTQYSGALPAQRRNELLDRIRRLQEAVKFAREEANSMQVEKREIASAVFSYLFPEN